MQLARVQSASIQATFMQQVNAIAGRGGESGHILYMPSGIDNENIVEVAQGGYREWIKEKIIEKTIKDCKTVGLQHIKRAKEHSHENMLSLIHI